jgi:ribosomal protein S18 acetylase RimI-like enzyme
MAEDYGVIRCATAADAAAIGLIFLSTRDLMTYLPPIPDEDRPRLGGWIAERHEVWVAEETGRVLGFLGLDAGFVSHLYVDPEAQNRGVGRALLDCAKRLRPDGLELWVFQRNEGARRFYERHGFSLVRLTDGTGNMEREPDALYEWQPG